jgi:hypothetical protein
MRAPGTAFTFSAIFQPPDLLYSEIQYMPHFCGRTHSTRDRRMTMAVDEPRPLAGDASLPVAPILAVATVTAPLASAAAPPVRTAASPRSTPTHQQIAALAYSYWDGRGRRDGSPEADWLRAERELAGS